MGSLRVALNRQTGACFAMGGLLAVGTACSTGVNDPTTPTAPPMVSGFVFSRDTVAATPRVFVVVAAPSDVRPECGVRFALSNTTRVIRADGTRGTIRDVTVGTRVRVWADDSPFTQPLCNPTGGASVVAIGAQ